MPTRFAAFCLSAFLCAAALTGGRASAANNDQEVAQLRIYIQQLEERVRQLTGENERLMHQVQQLSPPASSPQGQAGTAQIGPEPGVQPTLQPALPGTAAAAPQRLPADAAPANADPLDVPEATPVQPGPVDLSTLAAGQGLPDFSEKPTTGLSQGGTGAQGNTQTAGLPARPPEQPLSGNAREEYDAAYGYILTGDYGAAEGRFKSWLAAFPKDAQVPDAQFWLGESYYQQGKAREAATTFLNLHNSAPQSPKAADVLVRLGMSLAKLGEKEAACATFVEVGKRYPTAAKPVQQRVAEELKRNAC
jgi:tol-pal system protein YbgF